MTLSSYLARGSGWSWNQGARGATTPCSSSLDVTVVAGWRLPRVYVVPD
jgi:hypothetical protein